METPTHSRCRVVVMCGRYQGTTWTILVIGFFFSLSLSMFFPQDLHFYLVAPELFRCRRVCMQYDRRNQSRSLLLLLWEGYLFGLFLLNWPRNVPDIYTDDVISQKTEVRSFLSPKQRGHFANKVEGSAALQKVSVSSSCKYNHCTPVTMWIHNSRVVIQFDIMG